MNYYSPKENIAKSLKTWHTKIGLATKITIALSLVAGAYIGLAAAGATMVGHDVPNVGLSRLLTGIVFSTGLMMVVIAGGELFTGNVMIWFGVLDGKIGIKSMLKNWFWVYLANFAGALVVAYLMYLSGLWTYNNNLHGAAVLKAAVAKSSLTFTEAFVRGILCNWLVCVAVIMGYAAKDIASKVLAIFFPIMLFVSANFEHSIANIYYIPAGLLAKTIPAVVEASHLGAKLDSLNLSNFLLGNLLPVTLGNIVGGAFFVATFYWYSYLRTETPAQQVMKKVA